MVDVVQAFACQITASGRGLAYRNLRLCRPSSLRTCSGCGLTTALIAIDKREHIRRDVDLILHDDWSIDLTEHIVAPIRIHRFAIKP